MYAYTTDGFLKDRLLRVENGRALLLDDVNVIDGSGGPVRPRISVLVHDGIIDKVVPTTEANGIGSADGVERVSLSGCYLTPGLIDCHVHFTGLEGRDPFRKNIQQYPSIRLIRAVRDAARVLGAGFTTVRHLGHGDADQAQALKEAIANGVVAGPRMQTCGWAMSQTGGHGNLEEWPYDLVEARRPRSAFVDGPDACRKFVRRQIGDGAECIKIYTTEGVISSPTRQMDLPNFSLAEIEAITDEAHRRGVRVAAHATGLEGAKNAVLGGADTLEHGPHAPDDELLKLMQRNQTVLVPTLSVFEWAAQATPSDTLPEFAARRAAGWLPGRRAMVQAAKHAGVPIAVGTDSGGLPRGGRNACEILALVNAGLSPLEALGAATRDGARALGLEDRLGTIAPGKWADLVVWRDDPTHNPEKLLEPDNIRMVVRGGVHRKKGA
jgi:imidazolonepropionase-like amidohydrolase